MKPSTVFRISLCLAVFAFVGVGAGVGAQAPASETASQFYMRYLDAFAKAKRIEDVLPLMSAELNKEVQSTPAAERPKMFEFLKMVSGMNTGPKVTKEDRTVSGATLTVEATDMEKKRVTGTITVVREGGAWKLAKESW